MNLRLTELTEAFTPEGIEKLKTQAVNGNYPLLRFNYEGKMIEYVVKKIKDGRVWAKKVKTYLPEDIKVVDKR